MPIMDGFEATRQIRRLETEQKRSSPSKPTFITALTGLAGASDEEEAFNAGVDLYLTKPVQFPRLSTLLRECEEGSLKPSRRSSSSD
jgi:CheY-like chemotaxis protein